MRIIAKLKIYLEAIFGCEIDVSAAPVREKLPLSLRGYDFYQMTLLEQKIILAVVRNDNRTPGEYAGQREMLRERLEDDIVFVFEALPALKRNRILQARIPFIVPGNQLYLPPFLDLRERMVRKNQNGRQLSFLAQLLIIRQLLNRDVSDFMLKELGETLGYSAMSMSSTAAELEQRGMAEIHLDQGAKKIEFLKNGKDLWLANKDLMRSPVKRILLNVKNPMNLPLAGTSALAQHSMLAADEIPVYAVYWRDKLNDRFFEKAADRDEAGSVLQLWHYRPMLQTNGGIEPFSLYLSLRDDDDPRIESCLNEMMEKIEW